ALQEDRAALDHGRPGLRPRLDRLRHESGPGRLAPQHLLPRALRGSELGRRRRKRALEPCDLLLERRSPLFRLLGPDLDQRALIAPIGIGRVVEDREELEVLLLRDRVVLMVVALGAIEDRKSTRL